MRLFVAVTLPEAVKDRIQTLQEQARQEAGRVHANLKWVRPEQFHLTLKFLGECAEDRLDAIKTAVGLAASETQAFGLSLGGLGGFPDVGSLKIVWLGLLEGAADIGDLSHRLDAALELTGFPAETKAFHPHLTLARPRDSKNMHPLRIWIEAQTKEPVGEVRVDSIVLMRSVLSPAGPDYTELERFKLR